MKLRLVLVSLLAFALLWWFVRGTDLRQVWVHVQNARGGPLLAALGFVPLTYITRSIRWQYLLAPLGRTRFSTALRTTVLGFAALSLLPARVGDLIRPYLLAQREGLSPSATFATVIAERVLDLMAVVGLVAVYVWGYADPATPALAPIKASVAVATAAMAVMLVVMWLLATHPERVGSLVRFTGRVLPHRIADWLAQAARRFSGGFAASRSPYHFVMAVVWSFPIWLVIAAEGWFVTRAFDLELPFAGSFLVQALLVLGVAVPTPAGMGSYHAAYRYGMTHFFGAPETPAVAAAFVLHAISFVPVVVAGIVVMIQDGMTLGGLQALASEAREEELPHADEMPILRSPRR